jgi:hypothetical protein
MKYTKPQLYGYSAFAAIQDMNHNPKQTGDPEPGLPSEPAYQADE